MGKLKIFIDAGHNPSKWNTGAVGNGIEEHEITYNLQNNLAERLRTIGFDVLVSRPSRFTILGYNNNSSLQERVKKANNWGADLFLSLHANSSLVKSANGTECYVYNKKSQGYKLAEKIAEELSKKLDLKNRGVKTSTSFVVLKKTTMPSILIETAFLSNVQDVHKLKTRLDDFAKSISNSVGTYYNMCEKQTICNDSPEPYKYHIEGTTHIVEIDPRNIWNVETQCKTNKTPYNNFVNSVFFMPQANGKMFPQGIVVNAGEVMSNYMTHQKPVATLIIYDKNNIELKYVSDITKEKNVWFAVSGYGIYPNLTSEQEGFTGEFADVTRSANRPIIGYRKKDNKIVIAVRENSNSQRAYQTAKNLGLDFAISLDGGGSTTLKVNGKYKFKGDGRNLWGGIIWQ